MFFRYPIEAVADNWLHDCLSAMIQALNVAITGGTTVATWPDIIPAAHRTKLSGKSGLRTRWESFVRKVNSLSKTNALTVLEVFEAQNEIEALLNGSKTCKRTSELLKSVQEPAKSLFTFAYELVRDGDIRATAYKIIDEKRPQKMCPFCGYEPMSAIGLPKDALDHYLCKEQYSFAAANLRNLAPIGHKCNSSYKLSIDMLRKADGSSRKALDPFTCNPVRIQGVLDQFDPTSRTATWNITFDQNSEEVETWLDVFSIRTRLELDLLSEYGGWLDLFSDFVAEASTRFGTNDPRALLDLFTTSLRSDDFSGLGYVRRPFFDRLIALYDSQDSVNSFIKDLVANSLTPAS